MASVVCEANGLVSGVGARAATIVWCTVAFEPSRVRVVCVAFVAVVGPCLVFAAVVLGLPVEE